MKYLHTILLLLLAGCDTYKAYVISPDYIDSSFRPYTNCYEANRNISMPEHFSIVFDDTNRLGGAIAKCYKNRPSIKTHVLIDEYSWITMTTLEREFVIYHELGHCLEDLEHDDDTFNFMNTIWPVHEDISINREQLYSDFFGANYLMCIYE